MGEFSIPIELTTISILLLLPGSEEFQAACICKPLLCAKCAVRSVNSCFRCCFRGSFGSSWNQVHLTPAGRAAGGMVTCGGQLPVSRVADNGQHSLPFNTWALTHCISHSPATKEQGSTQHCGNQGFSKFPYTLYCLFLKCLGYFKTEQQHAPLHWHFPTMIRSLIKIPAPEPTNRWELARVQVLWDTVEGQGQVCLHSRHNTPENMSPDPSITFRLSLRPNLSL